MNKPDEWTRAHNVYIGHNRFGRAVTVLIDLEHIRTNGKAENRRCSNEVDRL